MIRLIFLATAVLIWHAAASAQPTTPAAIVRDVLSVSDDRLDYGRAKLAFDQIVDSSSNADATFAEIDRLAASAIALAGANASPWPSSPPCAG
jgi:hypothetical protein